MRPSFNTAGPCLPGEHYLLDPLARVVRARQLLEDGKFFTLYGGRQTGKTTCVMALVEHLNREQRCTALWVDLQTAREVPGVAEAMAAVLDCFERTLSRPGSPLPPLGKHVTAELLDSPRSALVGYLTRLTASCDRPLVLFLDEADGLIGEAMVSFLTQLREGYIARAHGPFPRSVVLVGMRQVRDYILSVEERRAVAWLGTASPFNIAVEAQTLAPFTRPEIASLVAQHTSSTGQRFDPDAVEQIAVLSQGHPWLVNALADVCVDRLVPDRAQAVTYAQVCQAKDLLILERRTHIDSLIARLREERVQRVLGPMLSGGTLPVSGLDDDIAYVASLGLIRVHDGLARIANPVYREVIPRALTAVAQMNIFQETAWYVRKDGSLDMPRLMAAWQQFWRKDGHIAADGFSYREAGPHLMMMAFLQRITNGGGRIEREYALGKGAVDLLVDFHGHRYPIELKLRRDEETVEEGLGQLLGYLERLGLREGWLVVFDLRKETSWKDKIWTRDEEREGCLLHVVGC